MNALIAATLIYDPMVIVDVPVGPAVPNVTCGLKLPAVEVDSIPLIRYVEFCAVVIAPVMMVAVPAGVVKKVPSTTDAVAAPLVILVI